MPLPREKALQHILVHRGQFSLSVRVRHWSQGTLSSLPDLIQKATVAEISDVGSSQRVFNSCDP